MVTFKPFRQPVPKVKDFNSGFFDEDDAFSNAFHRAMQFETGGLYDPTNPDCVSGRNRKMCGESGGADDRGGNTKFGVASKAHPGIDVDSLTLEDAKEIYRKGYWDSVRADEFPHKLGYVMFNIACGSGPGRAAILLQRTLGVAQDGKIGKMTIAAANSDPSVFDRLIETQKRYYEAIGANDQSQQKFVRGWKIRADGFCARQILDDIDADDMRVISVAAIETEGNQWA